MYAHLLALNPGRQRIVRVNLADGVVDDFVTGVPAFPDGIVVDRGAAATISPPTRSWMRIQGSKCDPSSRRHSMYVSIGMSG